MSRCKPGTASHFIAALCVFLFILAVGSAVAVEKQPAGFRKMMLEKYQSQCCVCGLNVPEVLRASHIVGWADDSKNRLNPSNGLCLSATYDAAFDKHLISFDESYRMILSPALKEYYSNRAFQDYFQSLEGQKLVLPNRFEPDQALLEKHRLKLVD